MCHIKMQELLKTWFNEIAVIIKCCNENDIFIMSWNWFDERTVFENLTLINVSHYAYK